MIDKEVQLFKLLNGTRGRKIEDQRVKVNFYLFFEVDQQTVKTCLRLEEHGGDDDFAWVLLDELV